jgi:hypothetical protein
MIKCGGISGTWDITIESNMEGVVFNGVIVGELEEATAAGTFVLAGEATVAGLTLPYDGMLEGAFVQDSETTGTFSLEGQINDKFGGASVPVTRTTCNPGA